jgi:DNA-binding IclR family transcriptional regulator
MPDADREILLSTPHERLTPKTITDPEELAAELRRVREEGLAFDIEERNIGTCAVAAPVRDQMGNVIGSIGVIVPTGRFGQSEREACVQAVKQAAAALSGFLGYAVAEPRSV